MQISKEPRHYFLYACILIWASFSVLFVGWYSGQSAVSYIAAMNIVTYLILAAGTIIWACLTYLFARQWFFNKIKAAQVLRFFLYLVSACTVVVGLVPATQGLSLAVHSLFATTISASFTAILLIIAVQAKYSLTFRGHAGLSIILMTWFIYGLGGIYGQVLAIATFDVFILASVYTKQRLLKTV